jgi:hypothetical protein
MSHQHLECTNKGQWLPKACIVSMSDQNDEPLAKLTFAGDGCQMDTDESREDRIEGVQQGAGKSDKESSSVPQHASADRHLSWHLWAQY